jgi:hypothetical protein
MIIRIGLQRNSVWGLMLGSYIHNPAPTLRYPSYWSPCLCLLAFACSLHLQGLELDDAAAQSTTSWAVCYEQAQTRMGLVRWARFISACAQAGPGPKCAQARICTSPMQISSDRAGFRFKLAYGQVAQAAAGQNQMDPGPNGFRFKWAHAPMACCPSGPRPDGQAVDVGMEGIDT